MMHKAWHCIEEVPYWFSRSSIKFSGHMGRKINDLNPILCEITRPVAAIKSLRFALFNIVKIIRRVSVNLLLMISAKCFHGCLMLWGQSMQQKHKLYKRSIKTPVFTNNLVCRNLKKMLLHAGELLSYTSTTVDNGLEPSRRQAIIWTSDG